MANNVIKPHLKYIKLLIAIFCLLAQGCSESSRISDNSEKIVKMDSAPDILFYEFNGVSASSVIDGELVIKDGCLVIKVLPNEYFIAMLPKRQASFTQISNGLIVTVKGTSYPLGSKVNFTGGYDTLRNLNRSNNLGACSNKFNAVFLIG